MRRRLFTLASALSLLLCLAVVAVWASGYEGSPSRVWSLTEPVQRIHSWVGVDRNSIAIGWVSPSPPGASVFNSWRGFGYFHLPAHAVVNGRAAAIGGSRSVDVPMWAVMVAAMILPMAWVVRMRQRARRSSFSLRPACGYDLRATPARCPSAGPWRATGGAAMRSPNLPPAATRTRTRRESPALAPAGGDLKLRRPFHPPR